jgi:hypothetical protein
MPILTPCADAGPATSNPHAATAANNPDFIFVSPKTTIPNMIFYNPAAAHIFQVRQ